MRSSTRLLTISLAAGSNPQEVFKAAVFLASNDSCFISGSTIDVNAGISANYTA